MPCSAFLTLDYTVVHTKGSKRPPRGPVACVQLSLVRPNRHILVLRIAERLQTDIVSILNAMVSSYAAKRSHGQCIVLVLDDRDVR